MTSRFLEGIRRAISADAYRRYREDKEERQKAEQLKEREEVYRHGHLEED